MHSPAATDRVVGIDLGTTYFKVGLFDADGALCGLGRCKTPAQSPAPGTCEVAPADFWDALRHALRDALSQAQAQPDSIAGIAYSSQANSFLIQDRRGQPLTPLILWPDKRAPDVTSEWEMLRARPDYTEHTGLAQTASPNSALNKVLSWRNETPERHTPEWHVLTISDYLVSGLTGERIGDAGTASLLGIENVPAVDWWPEALNDLGFHPGQWGTLLRPGCRAGLTTESAACLGLPPGIPVTLGSLDHHMAALGAGLGSAAEVSESTGTVIACLRRMPRFAPRPGCFTGPDVGQGFFQLAADTNGGAVIEACRQRFWPDATLDELSRDAGAAPPGSDGVRALPRAHHYPDREGFRGLRPDHTRGHEVRALFESTSASLGTLLKRLCDGIPEQGVISTGGGARSQSWMQIKADMLGVPFHISDCEEPACRGAAMLAAVGAGWFAANEDAFRAWRPTFRKIRPTPETHAFYRDQD